MKVADIIRAVLVISLFCFVSFLQAEEESKDSKEASQWDVNHPPGTAVTATINTRTGTWMSVDVSPDSKTIVFDLLGDIYTLPIGGGKARSIRSGMAWEMQPRFSPNGKQIAFTSDAGGGDNIWIMDLDGSDAKQVSKEDFRLLNSPAWSPDGRFIAAHKHFTSRRSLGAGEIWLYHLDGGTGLQLNKRPNDQKDLGEPAFSPDGRKVYFSRDSTPGKTFEYSKDSNNQIYEIFSIDRHNGDIETEVSGAGGAVRPTPSPDGKYLAFVRRIRNQSSIFLKDLKTGVIFPVYQDLDRDMQETWAIHGVYPTMAWTPDSNNIVFWARGKLHNLNIQNRKSVEIPFHVEDTRELRAALRSERPAAPDNFDTKMLRWVQVSPDGKQVVFQALGYLYTKDLPNGKPQRLTRQNNHFEFYPSFSADGRQIVYTSWNDQSHGDVLKVSASGGNGKVLTREPGFYLEPQFSPDGRQIVYRKSQSGNILSEGFSEQAGIYVISAEGGKSTRIRKEGYSPFFAKSSDRLYLTEVEGNGDEQKIKLISVDLHDSQKREHASTEFANEFLISPDEKWLAFVERFHVYVTPFTDASKAIELGSKAKNLPIRKVTENAGANLHWSGDSRALHWSLGSELFSQNIANAFSTEKPKAVSGVEIGFSVTADKPRQILALKGARIISMKGDEVIENGTVIIRDNRISDIGDSAAVKIPANAKVIDLSGKTIIPGLIDTHWHGSHGRSQITPQQNWVYYAGLAFGVTTAHDPSANSGEVFAQSELQKAGLITGPRLFSTGTVLYGAIAPFTAVVENAEQAKTHVARMKAVGAFSVKSYNQPRRDQRQQIIAAAREANMLVAPEGGSLFQHNMTMVVDGHSSIEHSLPVAAVYDDVKQLWSKSQTTYTPTLVVAYGGIWGERYWYQQSDVWKHALLSKYVPKDELWPVAIRRMMAPLEDYNHFNVARVANELSEVGVQTQIGAHGQREGLGAHWELWMFAQGGMKPLDVIRTGTLNGAKFLGMEKDLGSLEVGKLADLVVLDKNPLENIYSTDQVYRVMVNGRLFDVQTMNQLTPENKPRMLFFFE